MATRWDGGGVAIHSPKYSYISGQRPTVSQRRKFKELTFVSILYLK